MKHRMTIEFIPLHKQVLDDLRKATGAASDVEVLRRALEIYAAVRNLGVNHIELVSADGKTRTILIP